MRLIRRTVCKYNSVQPYQYGHRTRTPCCERSDPQPTTKSRDSPRPSPAIQRSQTTPVDSKSLLLIPMNFKRIFAIACLAVKCVQAFAPPRVLLALVCRPLFFLSVCEQYNRSIVYIDFYRTYEEEASDDGSVRKKYVIPRSRVYQQLAQLNYWFRGHVTFRLGSIKDYNYPGMYIVDGGKPCDLLAVNSTSGMFNPNRISAVYSEAYTTQSVGGCAPLFAPLGQDSAAAFVSIARRDPNWPDIIPVDGTLFGISLAHEIGHVLGFDHTGGDSSTERHFRHCGLDLSYPSFRAGDKAFTVSKYGVERTYNHDDWEGRTNVMSAGDATLDRPTLLHKWGLLDHHRYGDIFDEIIQCWFSQSAGLE